MKRDEAHGNIWVTKEEAMRVAKEIKAVEYVEIELNNGRNLNYLFELGTAIGAVGKL